MAACQSPSMLAVKPSSRASSAPTEDWRCFCDNSRTPCFWRKCAIRLAVISASAMAQRAWLTTRSHRCYLIPVGRACSRSDLSNAAVTCRQQTRHIPQANPRFFPPMQQPQRSARPLHRPQMRRLGRNGSRLLTQHRHNMVGQPTPQMAVFRAVVINQHRVYARLTQHQGFLRVIVFRQTHHLPLIRIKLERLSAVYIHTHQPADIAGTEPRFCMQ